MTVTAKVILDSVSAEGVRITTMELRYPRFIHSELMTHRVFSRNASSSRAVPVEKLIEEAEKAPAMPERWGVHNKGMQDGGAMTPFGEKTARDDWLAGRDDAVRRARVMVSRPERAAKQIINRILEPYTHINVVLTSTYWSNFNHLRDHTDADPTMYALARAIISAREQSVPIGRKYGDWHLPYIYDQDIEPAFHYATETVEDTAVNTLGDFDLYVADILCRMSAARCARVSYLNHDKTNPTVVGDMATFAKLMSSQPFHASPAEHQAQPDRARIMVGGSRTWDAPHLHGNFVGWKQYRKFFIGESANEYADIFAPARSAVA